MFIAACSSNDNSISVSEEADNYSNIIVSSSIFYDLSPAIAPIEKYLRAIKIIFIYRTL